VGGVPLVLKVLEGTQGAGVMLVESAACARSVLQTFQGLNTPVIAQQFIAEAAGANIRCFVVGDKVVGAMQRQSNQGEFRSNLHLGGTASAAKLRSNERAIAIRAAKALKLKLAGVDLIRSDQGALVLEVNSSPGLEGIEAATGKNVADAVIQLMEKQFAPSSPTRCLQADCV